MLSSYKRMDAKKIKDLEQEVRMLKVNELKVGKYKSDVPNLRRADLSDDSSKEEEEEEESTSIIRPIRQQVEERDRERDMLL